MEFEMTWIVPVARVLFAALFVMAGLRHLFPSAQEVGYARSQGVPLADVAVRIAGVLALVGGLSVLLGVYARVGALLLVAFLVPVTLMLHRFWGLPDKTMAAMQQTQFTKNVALLGGALLIAWFGSGPFSLAG
jgi:putative oxidoreductase